MFLVLAIALVIIIGSIFVDSLRNDKKSAIINPTKQTKNQVPADDTKQVDAPNRKDYEEYNDEDFDKNSTPQNVDKKSEEALIVDDSVTPTKKLDATPVGNEGDGSDEEEYQSSSWSATIKASILGSLAFVLYLFFKYMTSGFAELSPEGSGYFAALVVLLVAFALSAFSYGEKSGKFAGYVSLIIAGCLLIGISLLIILQPESTTNTTPGSSQSSTNELSFDDLVN